MWNLILGSGSDRNAEGPPDHRESPCFLTRRTTIYRMVDDIVSIIVRASVDRLH